MKILILSFLCSLSLNHHIVLAYPNGAGGCASGVAAVGGSHLTNNITTGSLAKGNLQVFLDGTTEMSPDTPTMITPLQEYNISVVASGTAIFEGALIRVAGVGTTLQPGINAQDATACTDALGVTHFNTEPKTEFSATFGTDGTESVIVDVTIVFVNSASEGSIYYYNQFLLEPTGGTTPAATPIAAPSIVTAPQPSPRTPASTPSSSSYAILISFPARALLFTVSAAVIAIVV